MPSRSDGSTLARFLARYAGCTLIVHAGYPPEWLEELLKQPGGGGHFRIDSRQPVADGPAPVEWLVHRHLLPLGLPLPLLLKVDREALFVRHLTRGGAVVHPSEIYWLLEEIESRHHACLRVAGSSLHTRLGLDPAENEAKSFLDSLRGL